MQKSVATERTGMLREMTEEPALEGRYAAYCRLIASQPIDVVVDGEYPLNKENPMTPVSIEEFDKWEHKREEHDRRVLDEHRRLVREREAQVSPAPNIESDLAAAQARLLAASPANQTVMLEPGDPQNPNHNPSSQKQGSRFTAWLKGLFRSR